MLNRTTYFIREHVGMLKLSDTYDILDPESSAQLGIAKEKPGALVHVLRFFLNKSLLPTAVHVYEGNDPTDESKLKFSIRRGITFLRSKVNIHDSSGQSVGYFKSKLFSIGGAFHVFDAHDNQVAFVKGDWKGWNFSFKDNADREIGRITKKWAGAGKELFTSADNYMLSLNEGHSPEKATLLLAAALAVDTIYKESK
jgi:uncharacterized protein YxjI